MRPINYVISFVYLIFLSIPKSAVGLAKTTFIIAFGKKRVVFPKSLPFGTCKCDEFKLIKILSVLYQMFSSFVHFTFAHLMKIMFSKYNRRLKEKLFGNVITSSLGNADLSQRNKFV
jgi:hypothetical protein